MAWTVLFHEDFEGEFGGLDVEIQIEVLAYAEILAERGPTLGRPHVDTLRGSRHPNMKEIRFRTTHGVWRVAFAFDPRRQAVLLVAGDK